MATNYLWSTINNRCPRCREGKLFVSSNPYHLSTITTMNEKCPVCGQATEIEVGFYYGTGYVSYALTVAYFVSTFVAWKVLIGMTFDLDDNRIFYWLGTNSVVLVVLQPWMMRLSRVIYMRFFVGFDKDYKQHKPKEFE